MRPTERREARILDDANILLAPSTLNVEGLLGDFCGSVITLDNLPSDPLSFSRKTVYLCGDVSALGSHAHHFDSADRTFIVRERSHGDVEGGLPWSPVGFGRIPLRVHGVGVYFRRFFDLGFDYVSAIREEHAFQTLTESTKPGKAHRTGIYLTPVVQDAEGLHFRLLRCSTNLSGPTENFRPTDTLVVEALNREAGFIFRDQAPLNHVLAQLYHNTPAAEAQKQTKARISAHADKTKDMSANGIMAFCTFYDQLDKLRPLAEDPFDYGHKGVSGLTRLHFRLKKSVTQHPEHLLPAEFSLTLYPNSVFFMPLSTNRLYTHEIRASGLDAELLPTRLGYVVRCSNTEAVHYDGDTFLKRGGNPVRLQPPTPEGMSELRELYAKENTTDAFIDYGDRFSFSMNTGDYLAPQV